MRIRILSLLAFVTLLWPANAQAGTISLDTFFQGFGGSFVVAGQLPPSSFVIGSVTMSQATGLGSLDALPSFEAYCVDFNTDIFGPTLPDAPGLYDATAAPMSTWVDGTGLPTNGSGQRAAWLYNTYAGTFADPTSDLGKTERAALQMAIWNGLYDSDFTVLNTGLAGNNTYVVDDGDSNFSVLAETYLLGLQLAGASVSSSDATWLQLSKGTTDAQDFIGPLPTDTSVPEPGAGLLLGMGFTALAAFRSRKSLLRRD